MGDFCIKEQFYLDGKPFKIISGGIHYFRVVRPYWQDRLEKLKAMGCNTVETYIPWNMHEMQEGEFNFEGICDVAHFIKLAQQLGLYVIVRPSPYICAEWEFGGLPAWLLNKESIRLRSNNQAFLDAVKAYYKELFKILRPLQITQGGPIILFQIENEYGYFGDDTTYLESLKQMMLEEGVEVPFVTSDGPWKDAIACGKVEGALPTGNFGSKAKEQFEVLKRYTEGMPLMCMEFWVGWFDHWGCGEHHTTDLADNIKALKELLTLGDVNIYMFEGGTNFGFMNGSNYYDALTPDVTSYDYDAVLTESGDLTPKYKAFQSVISEFTTIPEVQLSTKICKKAYGKLKVNRKVGLFEALEDLSQPVSSTHPMNMERLGQNYGYTLYRSQIIKTNKIEDMRLWEANDRAKVYMNEAPILTLYDRELLETHTLKLEVEPNSQLDILVENMGRVNFGIQLEKQHKGIKGGVIINGHHHLGWKQYPLPLENIAQLDFSKGYRANEPAFYEFILDVDEIGDTYLDFEGWGKGCIFVNGFNIGRFWEVGPQKRLYVPGPLLHTGKNTIIIFETEGKVAEEITCYDESRLG